MQHIKPTLELKSLTMQFPASDRYENKTVKELLRVLNTNRSSLRNNLSLFSFFLINMVGSEKNLCFNVNPSRRPISIFMHVRL